MLTKQCFIFSLVMAIFLMSPQPSLLADHSKDKGSKGYHHKSLKDKFFNMAHLIYFHQDHLALTDEQKEKIIALKLTIKKDQIMKEAEIDVTKVDVHAHLWKDEIDVNAVEALLDKKYEIKKAKAKAMVKALSELKKILTAEQISQLKALMMGSYGHSKKGSMSETKGSGHH